jgi:hypothetical protein
LSKSWTICYTQVIQRSEKAIEEWQGFHAKSLKWISNFYSNHFLSLAPHICSKTKQEARQGKVPKLGQTEFEDLHQVAHGFSSNLTYTTHDFYNEFHKDKTTLLKHTGCGPLFLIMMEDWPKTLLPLKVDVPCALCFFTY